MRRVVWAERAKRDVYAIEQYWLAERPDFVENFYEATRKAARFLCETPGAGTPVGLTGRRKWRVGRTPYLLFYGYTHSELRIVRIRHEHENWRKP